MKIAVEIPDAILRRAKSAAAERGISFRDFVIESLKDKLAAEDNIRRKPWLPGMGKLKHLHKETERINRLIEEEFEKIDEEMWR